MASNIEKRHYNASSRQAQAEQARARILLAANKLFEINGFEKVTIAAIACEANVSMPTVYAKFKSKRGVLLALIDSALPADQHDALASAVYASDSATEQLKIVAKMSCKIYQAEHQQMDWVRGSALIDPVFKQLELEREQRRYQRQKKAVDLMAKQGAFSQSLSKKKVKDILWAFTGRDFYRMLVIERGWSSTDYEKWLAETLIRCLLCLPD